MAGTLLLTFFGLSLKIQQVNAYYCDNNRCSEDEYCCGINVCCASYRVLGLWYFWFGLVFFIFLLSSCAGFWRYRYRQHPVIITLPYSPLSNTEPSADLEKPPAYSDSDLRSSSFYSGANNSPPPPYGQQYPAQAAYMTLPPSYAAPPTGYCDFETRNQNFYQH
ncbi:WW domain binding protein VOPP1-like [Liolophura sinensis]|uniref:WW domain binding protein VOPP1-like n=1 Tax=Liolophura sinensis TaxID=3198878 RepID=UPI003158120C